MSPKKTNSSIRCRVNSCAYHSDEQDYCSLAAIQVEPCDCGCSGKPEDESCCGSYKHR